MAIKLISTDFDGTLFAEFENPPIAERLQQLIGELQARGVKWVINTGRDMSGLMEALGRSRVTIKPDYLVLVERAKGLFYSRRPIGAPVAIRESHRTRRIRRRVARFTHWG